MVRVITQETYDDVVKENIEDFDMSPEEAVKEASAQFEAQGVDLSNIIKELVINANKDHVVSASVKKLKQLSEGNVEDAVVIDELNVLKTECDKSLAHRVRAGKEGAYPTLLDILEKKLTSYIRNNNSQDSKLIVEVLKTMSSLMDGQPDLLEDRGVKFIKSTLESVKDEAILTSTLHWASDCCLKHEMNRRALFKADITKYLTGLLNNGKSTKLLFETLSLMRRLTLDDDVRMEFGKAHDHARELAAANLDVLQRLLNEYQTPPLVTEIMATLAALLVRNELCEAISKSVPLILNIIADNSEHRRTLTQAYTLITALAGNDDVKRKLVLSGIAPLLVSLMQRHSENALTSAACLKCMAALCLREVEHSKQFLDSGAPEAIVACMNVHTDVAAVQKNGCWAIRNMVARCREHNTKFLSLGIESILNEAYSRYSKDFGFDIKSALRDLECDVRLDEQWTGKGVQMEK